MPRELAAGGLVFCDSGGQRQLLMILDQYGHWTWPKGIVEEGESIEEAALREVVEETGLTAEVVHALTPLTYWYTRQGERIHKQVHFFLMKARKGQLRPQLAEIQQVEWVPWDEAARRLSYDNSQKVWHEASRIMENYGE